jgi:uncharacterized protein (TIGR03067 family)
MTRICSLAAVVSGVVACSLIPGAATISTPPAWAGEPARDQPKEEMPKKQQDEIKAHDLKKLQGKWVVVRSQSNGQPQKVTVEVRVRDKDGQVKVLEDQPYYWTFKGHKVNGNDFTLDVSNRPKQLAFSFVDGEKKKQTRVYIYTFDDDQLLLGSQILHDDRAPADFGQAMNLLRLERVKE